MTKVVQPKSWTLHEWSDGSHHSWPQPAPFQTSFDTDENPLSEGGKWILGGTDGGLWNDPKALSGRASAHVEAGLGGSRFDDSLAHLSTAFRTFNTDQTAQGTVYRAAGYNPTGITKHEVELLLRFEITNGNARGYEVLFGLANDGVDGEMAIVRWNGSRGDYTTLFHSGVGGIAAPVNGDVLRAQVVGDTIKVWMNDVLIGTAQDDAFTDGQPGIGFWPIDGATPENFGWLDFEANDL